MMQRRRHGNGRLGLWVLLLIWPLGGFATPSTYVVSIGNNAGAADEVELRYAERDAREFSGVLRDLGSVSGERIVRLSGSDASAVRRTLLEVNARIRSEARPDTRLIVFYSGHASANGLHLGVSELPMDELRAIVKGSAAKIRLLIVDACRSGTVTRVKGVRAAPAFSLVYEGTDTAEGMAILTSSAAGENSQESDLLRGSFFSHHLIAGLRGAADQNGDGAVNLDEAYQYTYGQTLRSSGRSLELQHPTFDYDIKGKGGVILTRPALERRGTGRLEIKTPGLYLITEGNPTGPVTMELSVGDKGVIIALPGRRYTVQRRGETTYRDYQLEIRTDETTALDSHPFQTIAYDRLVRKGGGVRMVIQGISLMAGAHGETLPGYGPLPEVSVAYTLDFSWASVGVRGRFDWARNTPDDGALVTDYESLSLGLTMQKFVDLDLLSLSLGVLVEGIVHQQRFETAGDAPKRRAYGLSFGGLLGVERRLTDGLSLRFEGGPTSALAPQSVVEDGEAMESDLAGALHWSARGGLVWRL